MSGGTQRRHRAGRCDNPHQVGLLFEYPRNEARVIGIGGEVKEALCRTGSGIAHREIEQTVGRIGGERRTGVVINSHPQLLAPLAGIGSNQIEAYRQGERGGGRAIVNAHDKGIGAAILKELL